MIIGILQKARDNNWRSFYGFAAMIGVAVYRLLVGRASEVSAKRHSRGTFWQIGLCVRDDTRMLTTMTLGICVYSTANPTYVCDLLVVLYLCIMT